MTAAYNEGVHIESTIKSVLLQTVLPDKWIIVSDGSTDQTDEIVREYAKEHEFIRFLRMDRPPGHSFRSKVVALQAGYKLLKDLPFAFIGNLDGDITVESRYFESLLDCFQRNPELGLAGGFVCEDVGGNFRSRKTNRTHSVAHAAQLVRRECYRDIGGYQVLEHGGEDWHAQTSARMYGWHAQSFPELPVFHHRHTNTGSNLLRANFRLGRLDYSFGSDPCFEVFKCCIRLSSPPLLLGSAIRLAGFAWSYICRDQRPVSEKFVKFLRSEQKARLVSIFHLGKRHRS
jgi:poly-beta-1,6-N-acetyl-D-glucosamine synthase